MGRIRKARRGIHRRVERIRHRWSTVIRSLARSVRSASLKGRECDLQSAALNALVPGGENSNPTDEFDLTQFEKRGLVYPYELCASEAMAVVRRYVRSFTLMREGPVPGFPNTKWRHIDDVVIYSLGTHPAILDRVSRVLGDDILLWQSNLFDKPPGADEIAWHQDRLFLELESGVNVSVWVALDDVDAGNGCVQVIPGSHHDIVPAARPAETRGPAKTAFGRMADPSKFDASKRISVELRAGQFMVFHEYLMHRSGVNESRRQRLGLALRYTTPESKVAHRLEGFHSLLVKGRDRIGSNRLGLPPVRLPGAVP